MKTIKYINTFAISLPFLIAITYPIFEDSAIVFGLYSTMITGFLQVILGIIMLFKNPKNKSFQFYIAAVLLFFSLWYFNANIYYSDSLSVCLFSIPPILAIYLSVLIYKKEKL